jgi:hypothetical protein
MEAVTCRVNLLRGNTVNARHAAVTHCPLGHPYAGANLYVSPRSGKRYCRACQRRWGKTTRGA